MRMGTNTDLRLLTFFVDDFVNDGSFVYQVSRYLYFYEPTAVLLSTHVGS